MADPVKNSETLTRRDFLKNAARRALVFIAGIFTFGRLFKSASGAYVWQIDPSKCTRCGRCADICVLKPSAVKCAHSYSVCGYCELCFGYFQPAARDFNEAAYNQLCPTGAIGRNSVENPYYEYRIDEELCIGCGKCVSGCTLFGNGSLYLQVRHDICVNCNDCLIAKNCAGDAFRRVPAAQQDIFIK